MSANVKAFKAFLKERQTGLVQRSKAWVKTRQHTIGASEIAVLTGSCPFDTPASLMRKKLHAPDLSNNVACGWGKLFEPFARAYIEWEHNTQVFGNTITLNLSEGHPLYGKVTCSPEWLLPISWQVHCFAGVQVPFQTEDCGKQDTSTLPRPGANRAGSKQWAWYQRLVCWLLFPGVLPVPAWNEPGTQRRPSLWNDTQNQETLPSGLGHLHSGEPAKAHPQPSFSFESWHHDITRHIYKDHARYLVGQAASVLQQSTRDLWFKDKGGGTICLEGCQESVSTGPLALWGFTPCCILRMEAARHHRDRGAQGPALPALDWASDHSVPSQLGIGESKTSWGLRNRTKHP